MNPVCPDIPGTTAAPLSAVESGRDARVAALQAGRGLEQRLAEMGFVPGAEVRVVANSSTGPLVVLVKGSRLILGRGIARKIMVESLST